MFHPILYLPFVSALIFLKNSKRSLILCAAVTLLMISQVLNPFYSIYELLFKIQLRRDHFEDCLNNFLFSPYFRVNIDFNMLFCYQSLNIKNILFIYKVLNIFKQLTRSFKDIICDDFDIFVVVNSIEIELLIMIRNDVNLKEAKTRSFPKCHLITLNSLLELHFLGRNQTEKSNYSEQCNCGFKHDFLIYYNKLIDSKLF